jgi:hypothetical protein
MSPAKAAVERKSVRSTTTSSDLAPAPEGSGKSAPNAPTSAQYSQVHSDLQAVPVFGARNEIDL